MRVLNSTFGSGVMQEWPWSLNKNAWGYEKNTLDIKILFQHEHTSL